MSEIKPKTPHMHANNDIYILKIILFAISAFVFQFYFSLSTTSLYPDYYASDSAMFQTMGKYWLDGYLPYIDLFDHKGPLIFFINAIGYAIGGRNGLFAFQVIYLTATEFAVYRLMRHRFSPRGAFLLAVFFPFFCAPVWNSGNTINEYQLLPLIYSFSCMDNWCISFNHANYKHPPRYAFIYGICFAFSFLTRFSNALPICVAVAYIVVVLIIKHEYANLLQNALYFIAGVAALTLPFIIYFASHDALYEMWYATIVYNLSYTSNSTTAYNSFKDICLSIRRYFPCWCLIVASSIKLLLCRKGRVVSLFYLLISAISAMFLYTLNAFDHYGIAVVPFLFIALNEMHDCKEAGIYPRAVHSFVAIIFAIAIASSCAKIYRVVIQTPIMADYLDDDYTALLNLISTDGQNGFLAIDCPNCDIYLKLDASPAFRFYVLQSWMIKNNPSIEEKMISEFEQSNVTYLLVHCDDPESVDTSPFQEVIDEKYILIERSTHNLYSLYQLAERDNS